MLLQNAAYRFCLAVLPVFALVSLLTGCDVAGGSTSSPTTTVTSSAPILVGSPKGPGGVNVTPVAASSCSITNGVSAATSSWNKYMDSRFPFQFAVPPGWRAGSFTDDSGNDYIVQVFPPGSTTPFGQAGLADQEHIAITIALFGPTSTYAKDPNWRAETGSITISGVRSTLYDRTAPDCGEVNRGVTVDIGRHHFTFFMTSAPEKAKQDSALFLSILRSFTYTQ
jgi:hypothetical protein